MVHKYSALKLLERRERALRLGYIVATPLGMRHVLVSDEIAPRLKAISASLSAHSRHNKLNGHGSHFARSAALSAAADQLISRPECDQALRTHRAANRAKHSWLLKVPSNDQADPLTIHDPWKASSHSPPVRGVSLASTSARASSLDPWRNYTNIFEAQSIDVATIEAKCIEYATLTYNEAQRIDVATMTTTDRGTMTETEYIDRGTMTDNDIEAQSIDTASAATECIGAATVTSTDFEAQSIDTAADNEIEAQSIEETTEEEVKEKAETKEKLKKEKEKEAEQHDLRNLMAMCQRHRDEQLKTIALLRRHESGG